MRSWLHVSIPASQHPVYDVCDDRVPFCPVIVFDPSSCTPAQAQQTWGPEESQDDKLLIVDSAFNEGVSKEVIRDASKPAGRNSSQKQAVRP